MATMISEAEGKVVFQTDLGAYRRRLNKTDYLVFEEKHDNGAYQVEYRFQIKENYVRKAGADLIKNDHIVFQDKGPCFFMLFQADRDQFRKEEEGHEFFEENGKTKNYSYQMKMRRNPGTQEVKPRSKLGGKAGEMMDEVNDLLEKYGITEVDPSSPVSEYMKSWKLGHPDEK